VTRALSEARNSEHGIQLEMPVRSTNLGTEFALSLARWANMDDITEKRICSRQVDKTDYSGKLGQSSSSLIL